MGCNVAHKSRPEREKAINDMFDYWLSKRNIRNRFTHNGKIYDVKALETLKWFFEQRMDLPFDVDSPIYSSDVRRAKVEIDAFDRALGGKFSNLALVVPEFISKQDPVSRRFYQQLNKILDYERVNINSVMTDNAYIANHMLDAYVYEGSHEGAVSKKVAKLKGNKALEKLAKLREELINSDPESRNEMHLISEIKKFVEKDKDGKTIREFKELVELTDAQFEKAVSDPTYRVDGVLKAYNPHIVKAVRNARKNLASMSKAYENGLLGLKKLIALKYTGSANVSEAYSSNARARKNMDTIDESIKDLRIGRKEGGYFPRVTFDTMMSLKDGLNKAMIATRENQDRAFDNLVSEILGKADISKIPPHARKRSNI